jgi:hypothetical protein
VIRVSPGDFVAVSATGRFYYALVLDRIALFGGQLCFVYHRTSTELLAVHEVVEPGADGFIEVVDFIWAKRQKRIQRLASKVALAAQLNESVKFFKISFTLKGKAKEWWIRDREGADVKRTSRLTEPEKAYPLHERIDDVLMVDLVDKQWKPEKDPRI